MGKLDGKTAIVTGGASGFGEATALLWASEGAGIVIADTTAGAGEALVKRIEKAGGKALFVKTDVTAPKEVRLMIQKTVSNFGRLDILFNNAGILGPRGVNVTDILEEDAEKLIRVNYLGVFYCTKYAIPAMLRTGGGSIISTGSDSAFQGTQGQSMYCGTKGAVLAFSRAVAMEYARSGIRVNTVSPGAGKTPMHAELINRAPDRWKEVEEAIPMGRSCYPEDLAKAALFFASDDSKYITGANLMVDGGWTVKGHAP